MLWLVIFVVISAAIALFLWGYKRRLDVSSGPWITD